MTDFEVLYAAMAAVYLLDAFFWLRPGALVLLPGAWRCRAWLTFGDAFGSTEKALTILEPLLPLGRSFLTQTEPVTFTPEGLLTGFADGGPEDHTPARLPLLTRYAEVQTVEFRDCELYIDGQILARLSSPSVARATAHRLRALCDLPEAQRQAAVAAQFGGFWDSAEAARRWTLYRRAAPVLRLSVCLLVTALFVVGPWLVVRGDVRRVLWPLLLGGCLLLGLVLIEFRRLHRTLYPELRRLRLKLTLAGLACPPLAARLLQTAAAELFAGLHPLTVAAEVLPAAVFARLAGFWLRRLRYPPPWPAAVATDFAKAVDWLRAQTLDQVMRTIARSGLDPISLLAPPARSDADAASYCPRCLAEFRSTSLRLCPDCAGVAVVPFQGAVAGNG